MNLSWLLLGDEQNLIVRFAVFVVIVTLELKYNDLSVYRGQNSRHSVLLQCRDIVDDFVQAAGFIKSSEMSEREIHLFSYFFNVATWAKLIPWSDHIYVLTPQDFYNAAIKCEYY